MKFKDRKNPSPVRMVGGHSRGVGAFWLEVIFCFTTYGLVTWVGSIYNNLSSCTVFNVKFPGMYII